MAQGIGISWARADQGLRVCALERGRSHHPVLLSPPLSDPQPQSQRAVTDQLQGRVQGQRRPLRLPEARPLPGGHQLL